MDPSSTHLSARPARSPSRLAAAQSLRSTPNWLHSKENAQQDPVIYPDPTDETRFLCEACFGADHAKGVCATCHRHVLGDSPFVTWSNGKLAGSLYRLPFPLFFRAGTFLFFIINIRCEQTPIAWAARTARPSVSSTFQWRMYFSCGQECARSRSEKTRSKT